MLTNEQREKLNENLLMTHVKGRQQGGRTVSYIEGWHAIGEANRIFGHENWDRETIEMKLVHQDARVIGKGDRAKEGWTASYISKVRVTLRTSGDVTVKEGWGFGQGIDADLGMAHESAVKEAETDAMKRALMMFGNPFGLALYDKEKTNVSHFDQARITEFEEALDVVPDSTALTQLIREYTGDILDFKVSQPAQWQKLHEKVTSKRAEFRTTRIEEGKKELADGS